MAVTNTAMDRVVTVPCVYFSNAIVVVVVADLVGVPTERVGGI